MSNYLQSSIKSALIGFATFGGIGLFTSALDKLSTTETDGLWGLFDRQNILKIYEKQGFQGLLSTTNLKFPNDYITFVVCGGLIWPYLKNRFGWSNKLLYFMGSLSLLYIISPDFSKYYPSKSKIKKLAGKQKLRPKWWTGWYIDTDLDGSERYSKFIRDYHYDVWDEGYISNANLAVYMAAFWILAYKNIKNFSRFADKVDKIYPFVG
jgi:hypothetical protein